MALLRYVQHGRLGLRGFSRLPPVASWNPPSVSQDEPSATLPIADRKVEDAA
jgi:hypothetical protein